MKKLLWPLVIIVGVTLADQLSKLWAVAALTGQPSKQILGKFFMVTLIYNEGGAMGTAFVSSKGYLIINLLLLPVLGYYMYRCREKRTLSYPLAFIIAGALGNIIDRIRVGKVVDFLDFDFFHINLFGFQIERWWTFNIADAAISCALVWLAVYLLFHKQQPNHAGSSHEGPAPTDEMPLGN